MIALAYLFVLQGLLSPFVAIASPYRLDPGVAILCLETGDNASDAHRQTPGHTDDGCCDAGCLPYGTASSAAVAPSSQAVERPVFVLSNASRPPVAPGPTPRMAAPGSPGQRAPPAAIA